ncbi:hypothetical protein N8H74_23855 [Pseudomonas sp. B2M1-30]|uniref:hypothetical protein n=1 Tax=Pseudomonas TaxID=286 RepID=UPI0021C70628|nr:MULTISPECIES: hypothetical protein [Pseudomonas]MCU0121312.1 hypothetical protein [Pseudomonas sp. B2M1-30]MCU7261165.1 hypothetical protein [Pseudomonas koreensis]
MAKHQDDSTASESSPVSQVLTPSTVTFRDMLYTSRTVVLPDGRTLAVAKNKVTVDSADDVALKTLKAQAEFEQLKE